MSAFEEKLKTVAENQKTWLVTGAAGFIGSNLVEALLLAGQNVVGLDNFSTGYQKNIDDIKQAVGEKASKRFKFIEGSVVDLDVCRDALKGVDIVLHQAALGSVPRSIEDPISSHDSNVTGFLNMLVASKEAGNVRFVYASSSSVYGDESSLPKVEDRTGNCLSPYASTKWFNECYADTFARVYGITAIGLRYFNVFGKRQDPNGAYAAVIPKWVGVMREGVAGVIYGDGTTSRDFCYIENVVQANILAGLAEIPEGSALAFNVAVGERTDLCELYAMIQKGISEIAGVDVPNAQHKEFRQGDIKHSLADIQRAKSVLGYDPKFTLEQGMKETLKWFLK